MNVFRTAALVAFTCALVLVDACATSSGSLGSRPPPPARYRPPRLDVMWPTFQVTPLANGARVVCNADAYLPMTSITLGLRGGQLLDPPERAGLTHVVARTLIERTKRLSPHDLAVAQDQLGAEISASPEVDGIMFQVSVLPDRAAPALGLLLEIVQHPGFNGADVANAKHLVDRERVAAWSRPDRAADLALRRAVFGPAHPLGVSIHGTAKSLEAITLGDVVTAVRARVRPNNVVVSIAGRVSCEEVAAVARKHLEPWQVPQTAQNATDGGALAPLPPQSKRRAVFLVERPGLVQTHVAVGRVGLPRREKDSYILRQLFGMAAGHASTQMRQFEHASYGLGSSGWSSRDVGLVGIVGSVERDATASALTAIMRAIGAVEAFGGETYLYGVIAQEAEGMYPLSGRTYASAKLLIQGLPPDHLKGLAIETDGIRPAELTSVAREYVKGDTVQIVLVGDPTVVRQQLKALDGYEFPRVQVVQEE